MVFNPSVCYRRQLAAASPVAALTVHWTVIHYRDCASFTPDKGSLGNVRYVIASQFANWRGNLIIGSYFYCKPPKTRNRLPRDSHACSRRLGMTRGMTKDTNFG